MADFSRLAKLIQVRIGEKYNDALIEAGIPDHATSKVTDMPVAMYAMANEYGTNKIPSRPFMRTAFAECSKDWAKIYTNALSLGYSQDEANILIGSQMVQDIQKSIKGAFGAWVPNSQSTIKRKTVGVTQVINGKQETVGTTANPPLIHHSDMYDSVSFYINGELYH